MLHFLLILGLTLMKLDLENYDHYLTVFLKQTKINNPKDITDAKVISDGVNLIYNKFKSTLSQKGLEEMKAIGEPFNTDLHEAITNVPAPSEDLKGKVIEELEKGYMLNGKVIRFAKVVIGS